MRYRRATKKAAEVVEGDYLISTVGGFEFSESVEAVRTHVLDGELSGRVYRKEAVTVFAVGEPTVYHTYTPDHLVQVWRAKT